MHTELLSWSATAPGAAGAAAAALAGDSLIIKNNQSGKPRMLALWAMQQTSGWQQIAFPTGHDTTRGYRYGVEAGETDPRLVMGMQLEPTAQEQLTITISGSATAGDVETGCCLVHYPNLPGIDGRAITWPQLVSKADKLTTIFCSITGTAAGYTGSELINADSDLLLANRDYAVMGVETTVDVAAVWFSGPDTGNVKIGVPCSDQDGWESINFFPLLARAHERPLIPVINSGNKNSTFVGIVQDENNVTVPVTLYLALLNK